MRTQRLIVVALVCAVAAGCWNDRTPTTVASETDNPASAEATEQAPMEIPKPTSAVAASPATPEVAAVVAAFERYRDAVLAKDWEAATALVSRNIVEYYGRLRDDALYARIEKSMQ